MRKKILTGLGIAAVVGCFAYLGVNSPTPALSQGMASPPNTGPLTCDDFKQLNDLMYDHVGYIFAAIGLVAIGTTTVLEWAFTVLGLAWRGLAWSFHRLHRLYMVREIE